MNTKPLLYLSCLLAATLAAPSVNAESHRRTGNHIASVPAHGGMARPIIGGGNRIGSWNGHHWRGQRFVGGQRWSGSHWSNNWNWHHHHDRNVVFISSFGFPFWGWSGYPSYYDYYPYGYYPYGYPYGYGSGYYGSYYYNYGNGGGYDNGYGYDGNNYDAKVAELQRRLANAGYYRGEIDGIYGPRTRYALRAYRHDHPNGSSNYGGSPTLRDHPYSPPPVTTEPSPSY